MTTHHTRRAAVLGSPVAHSLSPVLHRAAYHALGLDSWRYDAVECDEAALPGFVGGLDTTWAGLSLTMPLKRAVLPLLAAASPLVAETGGANTVVFGDEGPYGHNTDVYGIVEALREAGVTRVGAATILGGGATAASALAALRELGLDKVAVVVRDPARTGGLLGAAGRLGIAVAVRTFDRPAFDTELVISTLPSGAADPFADRLAA
ncbi:MAG TPA: shikimate dehydrogenase, partial [Thermopolyspora sp.]